MLRLSLSVIRLLILKSLLSPGLCTATGVSARCFRSLVTTLICLLFLTQPTSSPAALTTSAAGAATQTAEVAFMDQSVSLVLDSSLKTATANLLLQNTGTIPVRLEFLTALKDASADIAVIDSDNRIEPTQIKGYHLRISIKEGAPTSNGYLRVQPSSLDPASPIKGRIKEIPLAFTVPPAPPAKPAPPSPLILLVTFVASLITTLLSYMKLKSKKVEEKIKGEISLGDPMGKPEWRFDSWASNLTVATSGLLFIVTVTQLKDETYYFGKVGYQTTSLLLAVLILVAPSIYSFSRKPLQTQDQSGIIKQQYHGTVIAFLLACVLTVWAVLGQLVILILVIDEIYRAGLIHESVARAFQLFFSLVTLMLLVYAYRSIYQTVIDQKVEHARTEQVMTQLRANPAWEGAPAGETVAAPLPTWQLL